MKKLFVSFRYGDYMEQLAFDWLPRHADNQHIAIAIDPICEVGGEKREWGGHIFYFTAPPGVEVFPSEQWASLSDKSDVLYPFYWQSDEQADIACIIVPPGAHSSCHYHGQTVERFGCVFNDDNTSLYVDGEPRNLYCDVDVHIGQRHRLERLGRGFSVHLLRMTGPIRFPDRYDHFIHNENALAHS